MTKFEVENVRVIAHHVVDTPPPREKLPMPVVALERPRALAALRLDFGGMRQWPLEWTVSVRRRSPYLGPTFGLFDVPAMNKKTRADSDTGRRYRTHAASGSTIQLFARLRSDDRAF